MQNIRRWYVYVVSAISLLAVVFALIGILRLFFAERIGSGGIDFAFSIAVIIIGLPLYLAHWLPAQRAARAEQEERRDFVRRLYIYSVIAIALWMIIGDLTNLLVGPSRTFLFAGYSHHVVSILVMGLVGFYHYRVLVDDVQSAPETGELAAIRQVFVFGFSSIGLFNLATGARNLIHWILTLVGSNPIGDNLIPAHPDLVILVIGLATWLFFWRWAEKLFATGKQEEQTAILRNVYLYLVLASAAFSFISSLITMLAGLFRSLLGLPVFGGWAGPISFMVVSGLVWFYHAAILNKDASSVRDATRGETVRQIYVYLIAAIGLAVLLTGLVGDLYLILNGIEGRSFSSTGMLEEFSWFTAALLVGLPLWLLTWRGIQAQASGSSAGATAYQRSMPRKIYLYLFLFGASMTLLGSLVNIVYQFLSTFLASASVPIGIDLTPSISMAIIAVLVLVYHNLILQDDAKAEATEHAKQIARTRVVILETGKGNLGRALKSALEAEYPTLQADLLNVAAKSTPAGQKQAVAVLKKANLIISPWNFLVAKAVPASISAAVVSSSAQKLMLPMTDANWNWIGVEGLSQDRMIETSIKAVKQILAGEQVKYSRGNGCGTIGLVLIVAIILLPLLSLFFAFGNWF